MAPKEEKSFEERYSNAMGLFTQIEEGTAYSSEDLRTAHLHVVAVIESSELTPTARVQRRLDAAELAGKVAVAKNDKLTGREMDEAATQCRNILELLQLDREPITSSEQPSESTKKPAAKKPKKKPTKTTPKTTGAAKA